MERLTVVGARQHNLKNVSLSLPRGKLVVITGPSGSGKSSLAFDTIYAEGQRRYVESLSAYARQFLEQLAKPDVDKIEGLSPAIAIEQRPLSKSPRSTVGTVTEISDYLRLLFARVGTPHCPRCDKVIAADTAQEIVDRLTLLPEGTKFSLLAPVCRGKKGDLAADLDRLRREGYVRARIDEKVFDLGDEPRIDGRVAHDLDVVVDRMVAKPGMTARLTDSVELSLKLGDGVLLVLPEGAPAYHQTERFACLDCGVSLPTIEPRMFSFNGPHGACPECAGLGARDFVDPERVVPDGRLTLREGAVLAWGKRGTVALATEVSRAVHELAISPDVSWCELPEDARHAILYGRDPAGAKGRAKGGKGRYEGIVTRLSRAMDGNGDFEGSDPPEGEDDPVDDLGRFLSSRRCPSCSGRRLRPEALAIKVLGRNIAEVGQLSLVELRDLLASLLDAGAEASAGAGGMDRSRDRAVTEPLVRAVTARLGFLIDVGLDYLTLDRSAKTLSSGEGQRIRLATQIGAALVGVLYVLDEPSMGLHARDNERLIAAELGLRDLGNTVLVVEHDRDAILAADYVVDMGIGAGIHGGTVVAEGTPDAIMHNESSVTGPWLSGDKRLPIPRRRRTPTDARVAVKGARAHNLRGIDVEFPLGLFVCVTGVSGSGKSSLVIDTLLPAGRAKLYSAKAPVGDCDGVLGLEHLDKLVSIDQAPIGRTPRSNPATYTGIFALLRDLFAQMPEARARGYRPGRFSFNVKGGRCESCQGDGVRCVEMHFLPDVFVTCDVCQGKRYNRETLEVRYRGLSVAEVLDSTVERARDLFDTIPKVRDRLDALVRVGLSYLTLGQPATTLSGGEAQRVKLARELSRKATGRTLYVLDEPTTGLHFSDIEVLLAALSELCDQGNTVVVIEHNLDVVACADWVLDIGPDGGTRGGQLVAQGTPEVIARTDASHTGRFLRDVLRRAGR